MIGNGTSGIQLDPPEIILAEINSMEARRFSALIGGRKDIAVLITALEHRNILVRAAASGLNQLRANKREVISHQLNPLLRRVLEDKDMGVVRQGWLAFPLKRSPTLRQNVDNLRRKRRFKRLQPTIEDIL